MFEKEAERKILEALAKGDLDNYSGKGEPFPEDFWDEGNPLVPCHLKQMYKIYKNASVIPEEITLKKEVEDLRNRLRDDSLPQDDRSQLVKRLIQKELKLNIKLESLRSIYR